MKNISYEQILKAERGIRISERTDFDKYSGKDVAASLVIAANSMLERCFDASNKIINKIIVDSEDRTKMNGIVQSLNKTKQFLDAIIASQFYVLIDDQLIATLKEKIDMLGNNLNIFQCKHNAIYKVNIKSKDLGQDDTYIFETKNDAISGFAMLKEHAKDDSLITVCSCCICYPVDTVLEIDLANIKKDSKE